MVILLFCVPGIGRAQALRRSLINPVWQESTATVTLTTTATTTVTTTATPGSQTATATSTVTPGAQTATATLTATPGTQVATGTLTPTASVTAGSGAVTTTASPTSTSTLAVSPTSAPDDPTELPELTATVAITQVITATATLAPFPTVTFIYPEYSATPALLAEPRLPGNPALSKPETGRLDWVRLVVCAFALLLWIGLAGWFIISQRRVE